ncbi:hypothetical protein SO3561_10540 [Streptomyces olivochromogenes]|uniref:Uncharacterized protein n=1 Tax=Streptomyces olivochromogenes TaxID=1963 RepID=A0A286PHD6_STROL|nr:hypothetical protein SO3561_10540 [Streptomyces olivochromogenes]
MIGQRGAHGLVRQARLTCGGLSYQENKAAGRQQLHDAIVNVARHVGRYAMTPRTRTVSDNLVCTRTWFIRIPCGMDSEQNRIWHFPY